MTSGTSTMSSDSTPRYSHSHSTSMHCFQRRTRQGVARGSITDGVDHADDTGDIDHVTCEHAAILVTPNALSSHWWSAVDISECMNEGMYDWVVSERMSEWMNEWVTEWVRPSVRVTVWQCDRVSGWMRNIPSPLPSPASPASSPASPSSSSS
jgi:hypothetical protein